MKKTFFYYLFAVLCTVTFMTSCSDDDDPSYPIDEEIAGTYKGALDITLEGTPIASGLPKNITITKASNSTVNMELKDFSFMGMNLGTITLKDCAVSQEGTSYSFTSEQTLTLSSEIGSCLAKVNGTITGTKAVINLDIDVTKLDQKVKVVYNGTRLSGSESAEAKITSFIIENDLITEQPVINEEKGTISFKVNDQITNEELKRLVPTFTVSDKAIASPASGVSQDFSDNKTVTYTVVAENGTFKTYTVSVAGKQAKLVFSFEEWKTVAGTFLTNEYYTPLPEDILATSAPGAAFLKLFQIKDLPVFQTDEKKEGESAIKLVTMDTSAKASTLVPAITAGSVFTGKFDLDVSDRIGSTKFGIDYDKRPIRFEGWYKYAPGKKFIDGSKATKPEEVVEMPDMTDECAVQAVLYEAVDANGKEVILTGHDINSSAYRVAIAALADGTAKTEYTYFNIPFVYMAGKEYNVEKKYKLAIVCSSSKEGDFFKGAGGSTLILDELEIIGE